MDNITYRTGVISDAQALLLSQFRAGSNVPDLLGALLTEAQIFEDNCVPLIESFWLKNATGWVLDQYGNLVGFERPGYGPAYDDDDAFRVLIYGQIAANSSYGTIPDLYQILNTLELGSPYVVDVYPAAITVNFENSPIIESSALRNILERATHPIEIDITAHSDTPFGFEGSSIAYGFDVGELGESF